MSGVGLSEGGRMHLQQLREGKGNRPSSSPGKPSASRRASLSPPPPTPPKKHAHELYWSSWKQFSVFLFCFQIFVYYNFFSFFFLLIFFTGTVCETIARCLLLCSTREGKLFREIWVECHCGILDLEADKEA